MAVLFDRRFGHHGAELLNVGGHRRRPDSVQRQAIDEMPIKSPRPWTAGERISPLPHTPRLARPRQWWLPSNENIDWRIIAMPTLVRLKYAMTWIERGC